MADQTAQTFAMGNRLLRLERKVEAIRCAILGVCAEPENFAECQGRLRRLLDNIDDCPYVSAPTDPAAAPERRAGEHPKRCPSCDSPAPHLHPAMQFEGEVQPCSNPWHEQRTPENNKKERRGTGSGLTYEDVVKHGLRRVCNRKSPDRDPLDALTESPPAPGTGVILPPGVDPLLYETYVAFRMFIEWHAGCHENDCPMDDTCDCKGKPYNDAVNAALRKADERLRAAGMEIIHAEPWVRWPPLRDGRGYCLLRCTPGPERETCAVERGLGTGRCECECHGRK